VTVPTKRQRRAQPSRPALTDAIYFRLATGAIAPRGRFPSTWDALLLTEDQVRVLRREHADEVTRWLSDHPEARAEAKLIKTAETASHRAAERAPLGYRHPEPDGGGGLDHADSI